MAPFCQQQNICRFGVQEPLEMNPLLVKNFDILAWKMGSFRGRACVLYLKQCVTFHVSHFTQKDRKIENSPSWKIIHCLSDQCCIGKCGNTMPFDPILEDISWSREIHTSNHEENSVWSVSNYYSILHRENVHKFRHENDLDKSYFWKWK